MSAIPQNAPKPGGPTRHPPHAPETTSAKAILIFLGIFVVVMLVIHLVMAGLPLIVGDDRPYEVFTPGTFPTVPLPDGPHTLDNLPALRRQLEAAQMERLSSYGWVSRDHGVAHVPLRRAMQIVAERGLPTFQRETPPDSDEREEVSR